MNPVSGPQQPILIFDASERLDESKVGQWQAVQLGGELQALGFQPIVTMLSPSFPGAVVVPLKGIRVLGFGYYREAQQPDSDPLSSELVAPVYELFVERLAFRHQIMLLHSFTLFGLRALFRTACRSRLPAVVSLPSPENYDQSLFWNGFLYHLRERSRHGSPCAKWGITAPNLASLNISARLQRQYRIIAGEDFTATTHPDSPQGWAEFYRSLLGQGTPRADAKT